MAPSTPMHNPADDEQPKVSYEGKLFFRMAGRIRRGVRSDAQLSCTETPFQKCSQSGKMVLNTHCYQYLWLTM